MNDMFADAPIPIDAQIAEVRRELAMRRYVYPRRIQSATMSQSTADKQIKALEAVLATLEKVKMGMV